MYQSINIEKATGFIKNIRDVNRCTICDKPNGKRMRYPCGHTSCDDCMPATESCPFCLTAQDSSTVATPSIDKPYTQRSQNACNLLNAFLTAFSVDVYKRHRISEQLKVERELFPQCIQAPAKYYNKTKSSKTFTENKENTITVFAGEEVTLNKMENSNANVREWLNKCGKRKPLRDLNFSRTLHNQPLKFFNMQNVDRSPRKRNHSEIKPDENQTLVEDHVAPSKKYRKKKTVEKIEIKADSSIDPKKHKNKDDSGISIDDDGVIVIDDSQSIRVDKDMNAWLAVVKAEKHVQRGSTTLASKESKLSQITPPVTLPKVPFYIKSSLSENCETCNDKYKVLNDIESQDQPNISITVESKSFTAIINVSKVQSNNKLNTKQSVEVQTNCNNLENIVGQGMVNERSISEKNEIMEAVSPIPSSSKSEDFFLGEANHFSTLNKSVNTSSNVIIAESDSSDCTTSSSDDVVHSTSLRVTADVHRSYDEMLVLSNVVDVQEHGKRPRRAARGYTPTSTDSSDKENYNPNREKRTYNSKKKPVKK